MCRLVNVYEYKCSCVFLLICIYCIFMNCITIYSAVNIPLVSNGDI